jgi:hypothetical protein
LYILPFLVLECGLGGEDLGFARVELFVGLVSFLRWDRLARKRERVGGLYQIFLDFFECGGEEDAG